MQDKWITYVGEAWELFSKVGFGNNYWQEYTLDKKGYLLVYTSESNPEYPEHIPYIVETKIILGKYKKGVIIRFDLVE